ncbi:M24 family metallopeptidase [Thermosipho atlanticus]|uniref:Xaa-Pro aminopeptidase n=1 Tax=Thermosipho atlanticus DSM 15807 TaxID=1123380 RepID=A0A1M5RSA6_9BACT|nr:aminopeptidase P family protein [Thermosipho atlanticus]SHH29222.1 Xaa-Pro aminopeptidase [Thermosipho atlanticus DSM 15807]
MEKLNNLLNEKNIDALLVINIENSNNATTRFISGFSGSFSVVLFTKDRRIIITDSRYWEQVKLETEFDLIKFQGSQKLINLVVETLRKLDVKSVGIEKSKISLALFESLKESLDINYVDVTNELLNLRAVKNEIEIEKIRKAIYIAEEAFKMTLEIIKPGITEKEVAAYLEYQMKLLGADKIAFETIVASGWRGALPHGIASEKKIEKGEPVVVDWGAIYKGYVSDLTRVFCIGEPDEKVKEIHKIVIEAQERAINGVKSGLTGATVDNMAREYIEKKGYGEYFGHSLGHGIGLEVHEEPRFGPTYKKVIPTNSVVTVEPGIYLPNEFGIRIEDDILVTDNGCEVLSSLPRNIFVI